MIIPAILEKDLKSLKSKINLFDGLAYKIQIDILDGKLVDKRSWPYSKSFLDFLYSIDWKSLKSNVQLHLMLDKNTSFFKNNPQLLQASKEVILQIESRDTDESIKYLKNKGIFVGLSLMMSTDISELDSYFEKIDMVQFMCIDNIGVQGSEFNPKVLSKIKRFKDKYPDIKIVADGGIKQSNLELLVQAGVSELAVGSAIFHSENPVATWQKMSKILTRFS